MCGAREEENTELSLWFFLWSPKYIIAQLIRVNAFAMQNVIILSQLILFEYIGE